MKTFARLSIVALVGAAVVIGVNLAGPGISADPGPPAGLANEQFEIVIGTLPAGWVLDKEAAGKGSVQVRDAYPGAQGKAMVLQPNPGNSGDKLLGVGQMLDARAWRGRTLTVEAMIGARAGAAGVVGVHVLDGGADLGFVQLLQADSGGVLKQHRKSLSVPAAAENLIVYAVVTGGTGTAVFDSVRLLADPAGAAGAAPESKTPGAARASAELVITPGNPIREIPSTLFGTNVEWIFDGQGLWSVRDNALDAGAVALTRTLAPTLIRFPGGVFSDTYHWRDGLGPHQQRPTREHYPGGPKSRHNFGLPELIEFSRAVGAELLLTANAGTGTPGEAANWIRHMKQAGASVRYWEIGNELYMKGDLSGAQMSAEAYARKFAAFAVAMRGVDPAIKIGAIGGLNYGNYRFIADDRWTEVVLKQNAAQMDFLAIHDAYAPVVMAPSAVTDPRAVYLAMLAAPIQIEDNLREVSKLLARFERPQRPISIAITEWGPFFHVLPGSPWVDHVKTMGSALFVASAMNSFLRSPRVEIANFFKLTEPGFMGWIGRRQDRPVATAPYLAFELYRRKLGRNLVEVITRAPTFSSPEIGVVSADDRVPVLDAVATFDDDTLTVMVVNKSDTQAMDTTLVLAGISGYGAAKVEMIYAASFDSNTGTQLPKIPGIKWAPQVSLGHFERGGPEEIRRHAGKLPAASAPAGKDLRVGYRLRPLSITSLTFTKVKSRQ